MFGFKSSRLSVRKKLTLFNLLLTAESPFRGVSPFLLSFARGLTYCAVQNVCYSLAVLKESLDFYSGDQLQAGNSDM